MSERKMATVRRIDKIVPIANADAIELAFVGGWQCVVKKGEFKEGDLVVYCEVDSVIPNSIAPFLSKGKEPRAYNGVKGEKLRSIKLRGTLSQGLILPFDILTVEYDGNSGIGDWKDGDDVSQELNIQKYEPPLPAQLTGQAKGNFPTWIPKTDQERIQNLSSELADWQQREMSFEITEKLEGSSMTVYHNNGDIGVCSRNIDLKDTEGNAFWQVAHSESLIEKLSSLGRNLALQGELVGPGIQGNIYKLANPEFRLFDIFDIDKQEYLAYTERMKITDALDIKNVPVLHEAYPLDYFDTIREILDMAEGKSKLYETEREGIVFKCIEFPSISFKAISNKYLLGQKD